MKDIFEWQTSKAGNKWFRVLPFVHKGETYYFYLKAGFACFSSPSTFLDNPNRYNEVELRLLDRDGKPTHDWGIFCALGDDYVFEAHNEVLYYVSIFDIKTFLDDCDKRMLNT